MSKTTSTSIREEYITDYENLRKYLQSNGISMGDFIIQQYRKLALDKRK